MPHLQIIQNKGCSTRDDNHYLCPYTLIKQIQRNVILLKLTGTCATRQHSNSRRPIVLAEGMFTLGKPSIAVG